jgi:sialic acid synthase SpsE
MLREIGGRRVGAGNRVVVIAEIGLNHGGSVDRALAMVDAAAWAGASAIKLQTIDADRLVSRDCPAPAHVQADSLRDFFARFELDLAAHRAVVARARERGLAALTTPFAEAALAALEPLRLDGYKIASGDLTYDGLIAAAAATGRPLIMSTGMSRLAQVARAVRLARRSGAGTMALLHCVSAYPTPAAAENLRAIGTLMAASNLPVGLSDHGRGLRSAIAAVALGASIYERHLVLDGDDDAIDRAVSSTPGELRTIVQAMEETRLAMGTGRKECQPAEAPNVRASRRGLYASRPLRAGDEITAADVDVLRPASLLTPSHVDRLVGVRLQRDLAIGEAFAPDDLAGSGGVRLPPSPELRRTSEREEEFAA